MTKNNDASTVIVIDFETEGLSPNNGDRVIEVGATKIVEGEVIDKFSTLMNPNRPILDNITNITGISTEMVADAPQCEAGMNQLYEFINGYDLVAHNKAFDKKFLDAELNRIGKTFTGNFYCSLMVARRVWPNAPKHTVSELLKFLNIYTDGSFHRAQWDADMTANIWIEAINKLCKDLNRPKITPAFIENYCKLNKTKARSYVNKWKLS